MSKFLFKLSILFFLVSLSACDISSEVSSSSQLKKDSVDSKQSPKNIISLAPHLTELVYSLGAQDRLIATVEYSDYPDAAKNIPRIGDAFRIDWEQLASLKPDLILFWQGGNPKNILDELQRKNYSVLALKNSKLFELPQLVEQLARELDIDGAKKLNSEYLKGLMQLKSEYSSKESIRVFYQISPEPLYTVNGEHVISEMLKVCGAVNVFNNIGSIAAPVSVEAVLAEKPAVILTTSEIRDSVVENWSATKLIDPENILSVPPDEVARASLRMLDGTRNICEVLDLWREGKVNDY